MGAEKFCLRWNDFESNISVAFRELREDKDFFDVTLACDDSSQVQAHKVRVRSCQTFSFSVQDVQFPLPSSGVTPTHGIKFDVV